MNTIPLKIEDRCTVCFHKFDAHTTLTGPEVLPSEGDVTLCINCGALHIFTDTLKLRIAEVEEIKEIYENSEGAVIQKAQQFIRERTGRRLEEKKK